HQMRVGLRRLRCALRLFAPLLPCPDRLRRELAWLTSELGAARDWEVLATGTLAALLGACPDHTGLAELPPAVLAMARQHRQAAAAAVQSARYAELMHLLQDWTGQTRWQASLDKSGMRALQAPLDSWATDLLERSHARLLRRGRQLQQVTAEQRHQVRISAKKIRYATEFFQALYPARHGKAFVTQLAALQDALGWLNDASVAAGLLSRLANEQTRLVAPASFAAGWLAGRSAADLHALRKPWRQFSTMRPPWALAR
ncbi:MAG: CHAD domain-containing protein, partial [Leptothrix sp. (in: b-proteobacteria)]